MPKHALLSLAREEQEKLVSAHPDDPGSLCVLGLIDSALGRKEEALREGRRAVELLPVEKDVTNGTRMIMGLAESLHGLAIEISPANSLPAIRLPSGRQLWPIEAAAVVGSVARRPVLRKHCRLSSTEVILW